MSVLAWLFQADFIDELQYWISVGSAVVMAVLLARVLWVWILRTMVFKVLDRGANLEVADAVILYYDPKMERTIISGFLTFDRCIASAEAQEQLREQLRVRLIGSSVKFQRRIVSSWLGFPRLVPLPDSENPALSDASFLKHWHASARTHSQGELMAELTRLVGSPLRLGRSAPLWEFHFFERVESEGSGDSKVHSGLLFRLHHTLGDGLSIFRMVLNATDWDRSLAPQATTNNRPASSSPSLQAAPRRRARVSWTQKFTSLLTTLVRSEDSSFFARFRPQILSSSSQTAANIGWFDLPFTVDELKALSKAASRTGHDYSINELLLAGLAGAMRSWTSESPTVIMWVSLSPPSRMFLPPDDPVHPMRHGLSNHDLAFVYITLPLHLDTAQQRLENIHQQSQVLLSSLAAPASNASTVLVGSFPESVARPFLKTIGRRASVSCSNVCGPQFPVHLAGAKIDRLCFWMPPQAEIALMVTILSYNGTVTVAYGGNQQLLQPPASERFRSAFEADLRSLNR